MLSQTDNRKTLNTLPGIERTQEHISYVNISLATHEPMIIFFSWKKYFLYFYIFILATNLHCFFFSVVSPLHFIIQVLQLFISKRKIKLYQFPLSNANVGPQYVRVRFDSSKVSLSIRSYTKPHQKCYLSKPF